MNVNLYPKVVLIYPPCSYPKEKFHKEDISIGIPIGLLSIAAVLRKYGYNVKILDSFSLASKKNLIQENENYIHIGASWEEINKELGKLSPDIVGITNMFTAQLSNAIKASNIVKNVNPEIPVIVGGPHASVKPLDFFEITDTVDIAVMGEGEYTMLNLIRAISGEHKLENIDGIAYKNNNSIKINPKKDIIKNLDDLPIPAYDLIDVSRYFYLVKKGFLGRSYIRTERALNILTSRGCPFKCVFCSIHMHMGRQWRANSAEYVLDHIEYLVNKYRVEHISFEDDNISLNMNRFEAILDGMLQRDIKITWDTPNGVRADRLNRKILSKAKKTGCVFLMIGVESGDPYILNTIIGKSLDLNKVEEVSRICKELDISLGAFFMMGLPGEKVENIKKTLDFALMLNRRYNLLPSLSLATPYFGTDLYKICKEKGYLLKEPTPENVAATSAAERILINTDDFISDDLNKLHKEFFKKLMLNQLLKPDVYFYKIAKNPKVFIHLAKRLAKNII